MEKSHELKPVERLYLISQDRSDVYSKKNKLYCLIYHLIKNENIKGNEINIFGLENNSHYEEILLRHIKNKEYVEVNKLIDDLFFKKTLVEKNYISLVTSEKKFLGFFKKKETEIKKELKYFSEMKEIIPLIDSNIHILKILCKDQGIKNKVISYYNMLTKKIQEAYDKLEKEKTNDNRNKTS